MSEREQSRCGTHSYITSNEAIRVTQCPCGTYHVNFLKRGVSVQFAADELRKIADGLGLTMRVADAEARGRALADDPSEGAN